MTTQASITQGIQLKVGDGVTPTEGFTAVAEVVDIDGPKISAKTIDASHLASTYREYINGLPDGGQIGLTLNMLTKDTGHHQLLSDVSGGNKRNYQILFNDSSTTVSKLAFAATVTDYSPKISTGDKITLSVTLKLSGPVTATWAT